MRRVFLGGSFDPVHDGHLDMVCLIHHRLSSLGSPFVISFLPTAGNPFKGTPTDPTHRLNMLSLACDILKNQDITASIDTSEIHQAPPVYTIDTVRALAQRYPDDERIFVMGGDNLASLHLWRDYKELLTYIKIWAFDRAGSDDVVPDVLVRMTDDFGKFLQDGFLKDGFLKDKLLKTNNSFNTKSIFYDTSPVPAVSSTQIRHALTQNDKPCHLPEPIFAYIKTHELYKSVL
ncbi:Nicotinate-nucleotide adenylyltransferase [Moraxella caprae]|uniref:Probable nicotinate-nucleotide adenylyltransferase n=1 Tax=Moraxella caprae TaxID=90240 RepID=A0A378QWP2_9GAMM|nr:nicotinate (nicotinamide) nucleotide adenylyltransferase [Moraxella caprae]STZ07355.1 Nicotinate-nucleotide adenylyltransferase [Moraxella caprae]